jgi:carboxypeptidase C (cathepsin A)
MPTTPETTPPAPPAPPAPPSDRIVETQHVLEIAGRRLAYTVTAGTIVLHEESEKTGEGTNEGEKPRASVFFIAYTLDGVSDPRTRPLTFSFNGGPGSSSVWLHLGIFGPQRVQMDDEGHPLAPPYQLVPNEHTLLDMTDLVFIDPVSTGYSRAVVGEKAGQFHTFQRDIQSVGDFIRLYTTRNKRWVSPKFVAGESYGTTRAAGLAGYLQQRHGMYLNGLLLISAVLNFQTHEFDIGNDLPYITFLPTYAATAWYHRQLSAPLQRKPLREFLDEVEAFALGEYATALIKGSTISDADRARIVRRLAAYTGLSTEYIERSDLRVKDFRFVKELLRDQQRTVGRLDSRFTGVDRDAVGEANEFDPSMAAIIGPYTATLYQYLRADLGFESDLPYEILSARVYPWSFAPHENRYVDVAETLRQAITSNPHLQIYVANGYYDLATPHFATEYTLNHLGLPADLRANIRMGYYEAGHMMYIQLSSLIRLKQELAAFIRDTITG